jgi:hypothetical protein
VDDQWSGTASAGGALDRTTGNAQAVNSRAEAAQASRARVLRTSKGLRRFIGRGESGKRAMGCKGGRKIKQWQTKANAEQKRTDELRRRPIVRCTCFAHAANA